MPSIRQRFHLSPCSDFPEPLLGDTLRLPAKRLRTSAHTVFHRQPRGEKRFHFDVPTPKVTVFRGNQNQDQETGQEPVEVDPESQTSS